MDPLGIRPLVMGKLGGATIFASKRSRSMWWVRSTSARSSPAVSPIVKGEEVRSIRPFAPHRRGRIFEYVYFAARSDRRRSPDLFGEEGDRRASWRSRTRSMPISSSPSPIWERRRRSIRAGIGHSVRASGSSARIMSAAPSSSRAKIRHLALLKHNANRALIQGKRESSWSTIRSPAARPPSRSCR